MKGIIAYIILKNLPKKLPEEIDELNNVLRYQVNTQTSIAFKIPNNKL